MHIDGWTLLLQVLNLLVLLALLRWLFYRPLLAVIEARRQALNDELAAAAAAHAETEKAAAALDGERSALEASREAVLQSARLQAEAETAAMGQDARKAADEVLQAAQAQLDRERQQATEALWNQASDLAIGLATRLLNETPVADRTFLDHLLQRLAAIPAAEREAWFADGVARLVTLSSAHPLTVPEQAALRTQLQDVLGAGTEVVFETQPTLLAGAELRFAHGTLGLNWAAELRSAGSQLRQAARAAT